MLFISYDHFVYFLSLRVDLSPSYPPPVPLPAPPLSIFCAPPLRRGMEIDPSMLFHMFMQQGGGGMGGGRRGGGGGGMGGMPFHFG